MAKRKSSGTTGQIGGETSRRTSQAHGQSLADPREAADAPLHTRILRVKEWDWNLIATMLAIKTLVLIFGAQAYQVLSNEPVAGLWGRLAIWNRWDALHYLGLAQLGYTATGERSVQIVFFPLYPWLTSVLAFILSDHLVSAFIVSGLCSIAAGLLLKRLVEVDDDSQTANRAVWFMFIFPTSYFLHIQYTESLTLALALGCFLAARKGQWVLVGVLGALASLSRINGLILAPAVFFEVVEQYRTTRKWDWRWLWILAIPLGFVGYLLLNKYVTGNAFTFLAVQKAYWSKSLTWPWVGLRGAFGSTWGRAPSEALMVGWQEFFFAMLGLVCTIYSWIKLRLSYSVWMTCNWLLFTSTSFMLSVPRYTMIMFPLFIVFARLSNRTIWNSVITTWSLLFLALFIGQFVRGQWAF